MVKVFIVVVFNGLCVYVLLLYFGFVLDVNIVKYLYFLENFVLGDLILVDKGFNIYD